MSPPNIVSLKQPVAIRTEHIASVPTAIRVRQHNLSFSGGDFSVTREADGAPVFTVDGKVMSWTKKRAFRDASGLPIFEVYRKSTGLTWMVDLPGQRTERPIMRLEPRSSLFKDKLDLSLRNAASEGQIVNLEVRGQDIWKLRTNVYLGGRIVMSAKRTDKLSGYIPGKTLEWRVDFAEGFDSSLAAVIVVVLAASLYDSSMTASMSAGAGAGAGAC